MRRPLLALLLAGCAHAAFAPREPAVDIVAMDEARDPFEPRPYVSARAYQHYLDALLAKGADDTATAAAELREALLYDPESPHLHTVLAEVLLKQGRVSEAEEELRAALAADAAHAPARLMLGRIAEARERPIEARKELRAAIAADPQDAEAYRELVRFELAQGEVAAAREIATQLGTASRAAQQRAQGADDPPGDTLVVAERLRGQAAAAWVDLARELAQRRDDAGAEQAFGEARAAQPSDPDVLAAEASFRESQGKIAAARELYLRLLAQRPEAPEILASLARLALDEGDLETVTAHARKLRGLAASIDPFDGADSGREDERRESAGALLRVAIPLLGAHRSADAQAAIDGALRLYPEHPELLFYRAMALVQRGHPREGAAVFEQVDKKLREGHGEPPSPELLGVAPDALALDARVQAAVARGRAGEKAESLRRMRLLFAEHPEDENVPLALLEAFDRVGQAAEAEPLLAAAALSHPDSDALLYALANAQDRAGDHRKSLATMRKVLALQPAHAGAMNYIGYTLTEEGDSAGLREAETLLARAVALRPDEGAVADSYGFCLLKLGRAEQALRELRRADRLAPGDPVILGHLGDALLAAGQRAQARDAFRRALGRLVGAPRKAEGRPGAQALLADPPDRMSDDGDARVRTELTRKLRALESR